MLQVTLPSRINDLKWAAGPDGAVNDKVRVCGGRASPSAHYAALFWLHHQLFKQQLECNIAAWYQCCSTFSR